MYLRKLSNILIAGCIVTLAISCASTQRALVTKLTDELFSVENTTDTKEKPSKVSPKSDASHAANNLDEINKYIDDLSRWTYVERVIAPYKTIDEAIDQDSIKIFHRVIASYNGRQNASETDANRLNHAIEFLLQKKADVNVLNDDGDDALAAFLKIGSNSSRTLDTYNRDRKHHSAEQLEPMVTLFIENGADIKLIDKSGVSTFERIVDFAGIDFIKPLLDNDIETNNALSAAVRHNHFELIHYLLDKGAILNTSTEEGKDALMHAAEDIDDLELFKQIVDKTSDINAVKVTKSQLKRTVLSYMIYISGNRKRHSQKYFIEKLMYLLDTDIEINEKEWHRSNEESSLIAGTLVSFKYEDAEGICKKLIEKGANVNLTYSKKPPLYRLLTTKFYYDSESLLNLLIEKGADVNFVKYDKTPLDLMIAHFNSEKEDLRNRALKYSEILKSSGAKTFAELQK